MNYLKIKNKYYLEPFKNIKKYTDKVNKKMALLFSNWFLFSCRIMKIFGD